MARKTRLTRHARTEVETGARKAVALEMVVAAVP